MLTTVFATKIGMSQAWTKAGKRVPVTKCQVVNNVVVGVQPAPLTQPKQHVIEVGFGTKKMANLSKPMQLKLKKAGVTAGIFNVQGVRVAAEAADSVKPGTTLTVTEVLQVGDVVKVQGISKGRGFAGAIKRHGFSGGPITHGQSDRQRAVGSIGAGTIPGRVLKGKRMPGHYGTDTRTVKGLVVLHVDPSTQEIWLSGPVPGFADGYLRIEKTGQTKNIEILNKPAVPEVATEEVVVSESTAEVTEEAVAGGAS